MPIHFRFKPEHRLVISVWSDKVGATEAGDAYRKAMHSPDWVGGFDEIADVRNADLSALTASVFMEVGQLTEELVPEGEVQRTAVIATEDFAYGMSRMYQQLNAETREAVKVFRTAEEAATWLGVPADILDP